MFTMRSGFDPRPKPAACPHAVFPFAFGVRSSGVPTVISGNTAWAGLILDIPDETHTVTWRYCKDGAGSARADCGWIDEVRFEAEEDLDAPILQDLRISPRMINIDDGQQLVTFTMEISDGLNGFGEGRLDLVMPSGNVYHSEIFDSGSKVSGHDQFGTYRLTVEIPIKQELERREPRCLSTIKTTITNGFIAQVMRISRSPGRNKS